MKYPWQERRLDVDHTTKRILLMEKWLRLQVSGHLLCGKKEQE